MTKPQLKVGDLVEHQITSSLGTGIVLSIKGFWCEVYWHNVNVKGAIAVAAIRPLS
jgi:hypothetical protein